MLWLAAVLLLGVPTCALRVLPPAAALASAALEGPLRTRTDDDAISKAIVRAACRVEGLGAITDGLAPCACNPRDSWEMRCAD